jgi:hypothetical protein
VINKIVTVACYGEVWTDENTNIIGMFEYHKLPGKWRDDQSVVTYGWLLRANEIPRLTPVTISTQAEFNKSSTGPQGIQQWSEMRGELTGSMRSSATSALGLLHPSSSLYARRSVQLICRQ